MRVIMVAMVAVVAMAFTACGSDDDDETGGGSGTLTVGTHRIDVAFDGETAGWSVNVTFIGNKYPDASKFSDLYENGILLPTKQGTYMASEVRPYSVSTDASSQMLTAMIIVRKKSGGYTQQPMKVVLRGYVNGKEVRSKTIDVTTDHAATTIAMHSEVSDADMVQYQDF